MKKETKLDKAIKYTGDRFGRAIKKLGGESTPDWSKEFDERFGFHGSEVCDCCGGLIPQIKAFISKVVEEARTEEATKCHEHCETARREERERVVGICEGMKENHIPTQGSDEVFWELMAHNAALSGIIQKLRS